jgi:hypothetical protein
VGSSRLPNPRPPPGALSRSSSGAVAQSETRAGLPLSGGGMKWFAVLCSCSILPFFRHRRACPGDPMPSRHRLPCRPIGCPGLRPGMTRENWASIFVAAARTRPAHAVSTAPRLALGLDPRGMARRKAQSYGSAILLEPRRAPLGAPLRRLANTGPRFSPVCRANAPAEPSASSWRGLVVVPGGAPMPPECPCCVHEPAGAAPRPASRTPRETPLRRTR